MTEPALQPKLAPPPKLPPQRWKFSATLLWVCTIVGVSAVTIAWLPRPAFMEPASILAESRAQSMAFVVIFLVRTFTFHAGIALLLGGLAALLIRRRGLGAACLMCGVVIAGSTFGPFVGNTPAASTPTIRILSANMLYGSGDTNALLQMVDEHKPHVIVFQEFTPENARAISPLLAESHPFRVDAGREDAFGQAVFSSLPFASPAIPYPPPVGVGLPNRSGGFVGLHDPQIRFTLAFPDAAAPSGTRQLTIQNTHLVPPTGAGLLREQRMQAASLARFADEFRGSKDRGVLLIGDFNFTKESHQAHTLRSAGLIEANAQAGIGRASTWPAVSFLSVFPGVRIDQAYSGGTARVVACRVLPAIGSDHRPVLVDIAP